MLEADQKFNGLYKRKNNVLKHTKD